MLKFLEPWRWPLAVVVSVCAAAWVSIEIVVIVMDLDPSTVDALVGIREWAGRGATWASVILTPLIVSMLDRNGNGRIDPGDFGGSDDPQ